MYSRGFDQISFPIIILSAFMYTQNNGHYSLTQGQSFKTIPELIQYYSKQAQLPRSDFYLGDPYHPDDH